ncbi:MAG: DUF309 domain-containing protein [Candidatus Rokubacteria bacterium]|nr:DUF309 domain-containing protein [Candidatus Rokubacteria bacterium]
MPLRNRLTELILGAFHDEDARRGLEALTAVCDDPRALEVAGRVPDSFPADLFERHRDGLAVKSGLRAHQADFCERARRGWRLVRGRPLEPRDPPLRRALHTAACLFDAGLYFEMHEQLEPYWMRSEGDEREVLQGLIQVAVGFQHLANGNLDGARLLLHDGCARLLGRRLDGMDLESFGQGVRRCWEEAVVLGARDAGAFDWAAVPCFPRRD